MQAIWTESQYTRIRSNATSETCLRTATRARGEQIVVLLDSRLLFVDSSQIRRERVLSENFVGWP
jgi:hypothetical protein